MSRTMNEKRKRGRPRKAPEEKIASQQAQKSRRPVPLPAGWGELLEQLAERDGKLLSHYVCALLAAEAVKHQLPHPPMPWIRRRPERQ